MTQLLALILAFWPVWKWYLSRSIDGSDEPWGVLALLTAALYVVKFAKSRPVEIPPAALALLGIYAACFTMLPALVRAALALACITLVLSQSYFGKKVHLGLAGLLLLSLPIVASLQFYAGYPLRALTGKIVTFFIGLCGEQVVSAGTSLLWRGDIISIDAPCSGVKMLWGGLYVAFTLACFLELSNYRTWLCYIFSSLAIFIANVSRTFILFFTEARIIEAPAWFHQGAGIVSFAVATIIILLFASSMRRSEALCEAS